MSALFLLNLFRLFGITEMFCSFVGRKQITFSGLAMPAPDYQ